MNMLKGILGSSDGTRTVTLADGTVIALPGRAVDNPDGTPITLGIRSEHTETGKGNLIHNVESTETLGSETVVHGTLGSGESSSLALPGIRSITIGDKLAALRSGEPVNSARAGRGQ